MLVSALTVVQRYSCGVVVHLGSVSNEQCEWKEKRAQLNARSLAYMKPLSFLQFLRV